MSLCNCISMAKSITISKDEYVRLKCAADSEVSMLRDLVQSLDDIKRGKVIRVR